MHHRHASRERLGWIRESHGAAIHLNRALVRLVDSREQLSKCALAGAVLTAHGVAASLGDGPLNATLSATTPGKRLVTPVKRTAAAIVASCCYFGIAMYFGSTSVNPQSRSWRAQAPRLSLLTRTSSMFT